MNENQESIDSTTYTCEFGSVNLDIPFAQQPSLKEFLDVPTSQEGSLVSDELLKRFLAIAECAVNYELANFNSEKLLKELHVGYQLWRSLPPDIENYAAKLDDLIESRWINQNGVDEEPPSLESPSNPLFNQVVGQLMTRCREEAYYRISSELLVGRVLGIFIYGLIAPKPTGPFSTLKTPFGEPGCSCSNGSRRYSNCLTECP